MTIPHPNHITRLLIIITGVIVLLWSGFEDNQVIGVTVLGWILSLFSTAVFIMSRYGGQTIAQQTILKLSPIVGAVIGGWASILVVLLMLFKDVRHAHAFPDYPPQMMLDTLTRLPFWAVSGGLITFALTLLWTLRPIESDDKGRTNPAD